MKGQLIDSARKLRLKKIKILSLGRKLSLPQTGPGQTADCPSDSFNCETIDCPSADCTGTFTCPLSVDIC